MAVKRPSVRMFVVAMVVLGAAVYGFFYFGDWAMVMHNQAARAMALCAPLQGSFEIPCGERTLAGQPRRVGEKAGAHCGPKRGRRSDHA